MAGALVLGTVVISFVLVVARPQSSSLALTALQAFAVASVAAGAMPTVRDRLLVPLRWAGHLASLAVIGLALANAPRIDIGAVLVAVAATALIARRGRRGRTRAAS